MGKYKDEHGESRVGKALRAIGKLDLLDKIPNVLASAATGNWLGAVSALIQKDPDITAEQELAIEKAITLEYQDLADARAMYKSTTHDTTDKIADKIIKINLPMIIGLVLANIGAVLLLEGQGEIIAIVSNFIGIAIANLFSERQSVVNFFFGSSKGSKDKEKFI